MAVGSIFAADAFVKKNRKPISYSKRDTKKPSEIIGRAKTDKVAKIAQSIKDQIFQLAGLSAEGSALAALEMFRIAGLATNSLNSVARKRPDLFTSIAATRVCWPMLWESHPDIVEENKAFAQDLTLGSQTGINYSQVGKTFSFKVPANHVAIYLNLLAQALRRTRINKWDLNATALLFPVFKTE